MSRTALITGGSGGLGAAVTQEFLSAGWRVVVPWIAEEELARLPAHERLQTVRADLFDSAAARRCAAIAAAKADAPLTAVVNLVGGFGMGGEYADRAIRVNAVLPGIIDTPANRAAQPEANYASWVPPERIASVVRFLCEDGSAVVTGAHVPVHGTA